MLRRALASLILMAPVAASCLLSGCGSRELPQDICSWLADDNNCYGRFADDVSTHCGYAGDMSNDPLESSTGYFADREDMSICIINAGGQVLFGEPPTPDAFPLQTIQFTLLDLKAEECGAFNYLGQQTYTVTVNPVDKDDPGAATNPDGTPLTDDITGGTFSVAADGVDVINVTCPGGAESFNFNKLTLDKCSALTDFQPRAFLESSPGAPESTSGPAINGYIRYSVLFPPVDPNVDGAAGRLVEYFNCSIPPPPAPCEDGAKNNDETDVDCGGSCAATCAEGQGCNDNDDCTSGACVLNGGLQQCSA
jgi:hypothetical protein